ncbi:hypothetical protein BGZ74_000431 [Mortierella antarctica]|nr:hypothetical protein BGZ74_000431 [Mortierella antarctica]KAG0361408.1 hypothetical protein BG005_008424 [Podila minutissima]
MDGVDCDWCLVCEKHTSNGAAYCSAECRSTDLISSSASSTSSTASDASFYSMTDSNGSPLSIPNDNYPMPPFVRKQRTSIPNIYAHCASTPNPHPSSLMFTPAGNTPSALSHHLQLQKQSSSMTMSSSSSSLPPPPSSSGNISNTAQYPLFYATLNALRPSSPAPLSDSRRS